MDHRDPTVPDEDPDLESHVRQLVDINPKRAAANLNKMPEILAAVPGEYGHGPAADPAANRELVYRRAIELARRNPDDWSGRLGA